tara:strand:- start:1409 stop:1960 length:552 start_codon:yes stop_codon:yes gene_type:complete
MSQLKVNSIVPVGGASSGASGGIIQVIQKEATQTGTISCSANTLTSLGGNFNVSITPRSSSSKILLIGRICGEFGGLAFLYKSALGFTRNGSEVWNGESAGSAARGYGGWADNYHNDASNTMEVAEIIYLDSPNTTSQVSYQICIDTGGQSGTFYYNRNVASGTTDARQRAVSTVIAMEVSPS